MPGSNPQRGSNDLIPATIKCGVCQEEKQTLKHYSSKQINEYRNFHYKHRPDAKSRNGNDEKADLYIRCKVCVGIRREEMTCRICRKTKSIDWFALAQRKDPDHARCRECMRAIDLVLPNSSNPTDTGVEDQDDEISSYGKNQDDHFQRNVTGEYWIDQDGDASSVSNPWSSRATSEVAYRGPISSRQSDIGFGTKTVASNIPRSGKVGTLTLKNMDALDKQLEALNVKSEDGATIKSLNRERAALSEDTESVNSDETIRKEAGVSLPPAITAGNPPMIGRMPNYDDSDGDEDYHGNLHLLRPMMKNVKINLYDDFDPDGEEHTLGTDRFTTGTDKSQGNYQDMRASTTSTASNIGYDADGSSVNDWKEVAQQPTTFASGFANKYFKSAADVSNPRKFARIRPTNLRVDDVDENALNKNYETPKYNGRRKNRGGYGSDDE